MKRIRQAALVVASVAALGSARGRGAQRSVLPYGLKAGHHPVRAQQATTRRGLSSWVPADSGRYPLVVVTGDRPAALDLVLPQYLASHGFTVVRALGTAGRSVVQSAGDSLAVAVLTWTRDSSATVIIETGDSGFPPLSIRVIHSAAAIDGRLRLVLPPAGSRPGAAARRYRTVCAVTQAILNATLTATPSTLAQLATRLTAAGLQGTYIRAP